MNKRRTVVMGLLVAMLLAGCETFGPKQIALWESYTSPEGWRGRRLEENGRPVVEELDAVGRDGRTDVWRYYEKGVLFRERHDRDADGRIDFLAEYDHRDGTLQRLLRDTDFDGDADLTIAYDRRERWIQTWDADGDGEPNLIFFFRGEPDLLGKLGQDVYELTDLRPLVAGWRWDQVQLDRDGDGVFDTWVRYQDGREVARGVGPADPQGQPRTWRATPPPQAPTAPAPAESAAPSSAPAPVEPVVPAPVPAPVEEPAPSEEAEPASESGRTETSVDTESAPFAPLEALPLETGDAMPEEISTPPAATTPASGTTNATTAVSSPSGAAGSGDESASGAATRSNLAPEARVRARVVPVAPTEAP